MNKIIRAISIVLLGAAAAALFLFYTPLIDGKSPKDFAMGNDIVKYALGGLLVLSAFITPRALGFKTKKVLRVLLGLVIIALPIVAGLIPNKDIPIGPASLNLTYTIIGGGYVIVFLFLMIMHIIELIKRRGISKIFVPFADLAMMVLVFCLYVKLVVPQIDQISFYQYVQMGLQYAHYVAGGLLAAAGVIAILELFVRKKAA